MSWRTVKLGELVENFSVRAKDVGGAEGLDFYGVSNEDGIIKTKYAAEDKAEDYKIIEKGCFAYNPYRVNVGSIGLVSDDTRGLISPAYVIFKPKPKSIIPELLFKFLKSAEGLRQIIFYARGTVRQALRFEDLCNIEISIPDYSEQQGLFNKLINSQKSSNILGAELKNQLELLKKLRQQLLQDAVQGKLVVQNKKDEPASELLKKIKAEKQKLIAEKKLKKEKELPPIKPSDIPFEIPENWVWCRLGEMVNIKSGKRIHAADYRPSGVPFLRSGEIGSLGRGENLKTELYISESKYQEVKQKFGIPKAGDILIACIGGSIGNTWIVDEREFYYKDGNLVLIESILNVNYNYLLYYLKSPFFWNNTILNATDSSYNALTIIKLNQSEFPMPPLHEQEQIVSKLEKLMAYCDGLEQSIKESQGYNEMLLQQVLREALQPKEEPKTLSLENRKLQLPLKTVLGAHIVDVCNTTDFGRVKFQKLLFLTEYHCKIDFESHYVQKAAGPHDDVLIKSIENEFKRQRFFEVKQENSDTHRVRYTKLPNASQINSMFLENFAGETINVNNLLIRLRAFSWAECEVIATIYAVWNNRLIKGQTITEESLLEDFMAWSSRKSNFIKDFYKKLLWMREENIVPDGWGKYVDKPEEKMA